MSTCLVRGSGDVGSAVALALHRAGHRVAIHDVPTPSYPRRGMAFVDGYFDGHASLDGIEAFLADDAAQLCDTCLEGGLVTLSALEIGACLEALEPDVLVDARMRKREIPERQRGYAALTIGAGPNFIAGDTTDLAVETAWGEALGRVLRSGDTLRFSGEPRRIAGFARERFLYAPYAGVVFGEAWIGRVVAKGEVLGRLGDEVLRAPLDGVVTGLTRSGVAVRPGAKVGEIDPRGDPRCAFGVPERAGRIADGVLEALRLEGYRADPTRQGLHPGEFRP